MPADGWKRRASHCSLVLLPCLPSFAHTLGPATQSLKLGQALALTLLQSHHSCDLVVTEGDLGLCL